MCTASTQTGTPYFASPEIWNDKPYDYKCDIWSVGCIIYEMASLHVPFRGTSMQNLYQNVLRGIYQQIPMNYSDKLRKIIKQILVVNPKNRPSSAELLENPIIKQKMNELGLSKYNNLKNEEKARLMKTIKIPMNMSQINMELPQKKYEKEKMLLNDEYETAKRTFYHPPAINNEGDNDIKNKNEIDNKLNNNTLDNNKINDINNNNINNHNINRNTNDKVDEKYFIENLLGKDLNKIQDIINNLDNNSNKYMLNKKSLKNIDNNEEEIKNSMLINGNIGTTSDNKKNNLEEHNKIEYMKCSPKVRENINNNKYSNINYDY
jgi:NIMA (never in mitosis gene a)-related kinase